MHAFPSILKHDLRVAYIALYKRCHVRYFPCSHEMQVWAKCAFLSRDSTTKPTGSVSVQKQQMLCLVLHVEKKIRRGVWGPSLQEVLRN